MVARNDKTRPARRVLWMHRSEKELYPNLIDAGVVGAGDLPELRVGSVMVGAIPLRVVECIERLQPQLQPHFFPEFEVLEEGHVPVIDSRPTQDVPARGANHASVGLRECRRIKPLGDTLVKSAVWISDQMGPIIEIVEGTSQVLGVDRVGETPLESSNAIQLPAADNQIRSFVNAGKILSAAAKGQLVDEARNQPMVHIEIRARVLEL